MKKMKKINIFVAVLLAFSFLFSFSSCTQKEVENDKFTIVCSVFAQYDFCKQIVGDKADVILLQKNGNDMHSFDPTAKNIIDVHSADMLVLVSFDVEAWAEGVIESADNSELCVVEIMDFADTLLDEEDIVSIRNDHTHDHDHDHDHDHECNYDEHVWMSIDNSLSIINKLCERIVSLCPEYKDEFYKNASEYVNKLSLLADEYESLNLKGKRFIVADRFPFLYFANEWELNYIAAFPGCSNETNSSFEVIVNLIEEVNKSGAYCIFTTEDENLNIAEQISNSTGAKIYKLSSCQSITKEELYNNESYYSIMKRNLEVLKEAYN